VPNASLGHGSGVPFQWAATPNLLLQSHGCKLADWAYSCHHLYAIQHSVSLVPILLPAVVLGLLLLLLLVLLALLLLLLLPPLPPPLLLLTLLLPPVCPAIDGNPGHDPTGDVVGCGFEA